MIPHYLNSVVKNIDDLIRLTKDDIEDIKNAKNESIYNRTKIKDEIIAIFENNKALLDNELVKLIENAQEKELSDILSEEEKQTLDLLKLRLKELQKLNKEYAKFVVVVNEFYSSLFDRIFPTEMDDYKKINPRSFSLLKVMA